jgi:hypothetical protein
MVIYRWLTLLASILNMETACISETSGTLPTSTQCKDPKWTWKLFLSMYCLFALPQRPICRLLGLHFDSENWVSSYFRNVQWTSTGLHSVISRMIFIFTAELNDFETQNFQTGLSVWELRWYCLQKGGHWNYKASRELSDHQGRIPATTTIKRQKHISIIIRF